MSCFEEFTEWLSVLNDGTFKPLFMQMLFSYWINLLGHRFCMIVGVKLLLMGYFFYFFLLFHKFPEMSRFILY